MSFRKLAFSTCTVLGSSFMSMGSLLPAEVMLSTYLPMAVVTVKVWSCTTSPAGGFAGAASWAQRPATGSRRQGSAQLTDSRREWGEAGVFMG